jgi:hypothetical protein
MQGHPSADSMASAGGQLLYAALLLGSWFTETFENVAFDAAAG